jgi:serine/threonine protein phosphatase 1
MALLMNFSKVILLGQNLMETALSLDQRIKPNDLLYPKRLTLYDEIYIGHTPVTHWRNRTCTKSLYLEYRYRSGFKGPLSILDVDKKSAGRASPVTLYFDEKGRN